MHHIYVLPDQPHVLERDARLIADAAIDLLDRNYVPILPIIGVPGTYAAKIEAAHRSIVCRCDAALGVGITAEKVRQLKTNRKFPAGTPVFFSIDALDAFLASEESNPYFKD